MLRSIREIPADHLSLEWRSAGVNTFILSQSAETKGWICDPSNVVNVAFRQLQKFGHLHRAEIGSESKRLHHPWRQR